MRMIRKLVYLALLTVLTACGSLVPKPPPLPLELVWTLTLGGPGDNLNINATVAPDGTLYVVTDEQFTDPASNFLRLFRITPDGKSSGTAIAVPQNPAPPISDPTDPASSPDTAFIDAAAKRGWPVCNNRVDPQQGALVVSGGGLYLSTIHPKLSQNCRTLFGFPVYNALMRFDPVTLKRTMLTFFGGDEPPFNGDPAQSTVLIKFTATGTDAARMVGTWAASPSSFGAPVFGQIGPDGAWSADDPAARYPAYTDFGFRMAVTAPDGGVYAVGDGPAQGTLLARLSPTGDVLWQVKLFDFLDSAEVNQISPYPGDLVFIGGTTAAPIAGVQPPEPLTTRSPYVARFDGGKLTWIHYWPNLGNTYVSVAYDPAKNEVYATEGTHLYFLDAQTGEVLPKSYVTKDNASGPFNLWDVDPNFDLTQFQDCQRLYLLWGGDLVCVGKARPVDNASAPRDQWRQGDAQVWVARYRRR